MRIDKFFSEQGIMSRSIIKSEIKKGLIKVNDVVIKDSGYNIDENNDVVKYKDKIYSYEKFVYYVLNKPKGVVTAKADKMFMTVMDLIDDPRSDITPVGRLDKDTTGMLLITNDGKFLHELMAPNKHVSKTYYAEIEGRVTAEDVRLFSEGVDIGDGDLTMPAELKILEQGDISKIELTIYEGRYHQVKRMFESVGKKVLELDRVAIGKFRLDSDVIKVGKYIKLTKEELEELIANK